MSAKLPDNQVPPVDIKSEEQVLQHMLHEDGAEAIKAVRAILTGDDFYHTYNRDLYIAILERYEANVPVDDFTADRFQEIAKEFSKIGDMAPVEYFERLRESAVSGSPENAVYYAAKVKEKAQLRGQLSELIKIVIGINSDPAITALGVSDRLRGVITAYTPITPITPIAAEKDSRLVFPQLKQDFFNDYVKLFEGVTESPKSYHVFCFAAAVGMMLERKIYICYPHQTFPNMFVLLIGRSGIDRKDTALVYGKNLAAQLHTIQVLPAISSYEGLLEAMSKPPEGPEDIDPTRTLVALSEFDALLKKARIDSTSNIIPNLCNIYDCPDEARLPTKVNPVTVKDPFLSIVSTIQPGVIQEAFRSGDIHSGFAGRWMYVHDTAEESIAMPSKMNTGAWNDLVKRLSGSRDLWRDRGTTEIALAADATAMWEEFYKWQREQNADAEILSALTVRIPGHVLKMAMIFAALDYFTEISVDHLEDAIAIGKWLMANVKHLFHEFGQPEVEKAERRIQEILSEGLRTRRQIQQRCRQFSTETFSRAVKNLIGAGLVEEKGTKKGKSLSLAP